MYEYQHLQKIDIIGIIKTELPKTEYISFKRTVKMNNTMTLTLVKYALGVVIILLLVFIIAVITPKIAAFIDKKRNKASIPDEDIEYINPKDYTVKDPYGKGEKLEGFDPNYKIYNEDIYGFNRKNKSTKTNSNNDKEN